MYALVIDNAIQSVGPLPRAARRLSDGAWVTPPGGDWTPSQAAESGYFPVTETPRPEDTATTTHERDYDLVNGVPTVVWNERPWTQQELDDRADAAAAQARYETHEGILDATAALMEDAHEDGAPWVQPTGAHNAIGFGRTVTHSGKTWRSKHRANVWEPSPSSPWWEEVVDGDPGPQPWALDVYYTPPTEVTFEGNTYECTFEHLSQPGWEPSNPTMHSVWKLTTP